MTPRRNSKDRLAGQPIQIYYKMNKKRPCTQSGFAKKRTLEQKSCWKKHKQTNNQILASTQCLDFTRNTTWLASCFSLIKKPKYKFSLNLCSRNQSVIAGVGIFYMIAASLSNILIWTSTCGSVRYKRKIQSRKTQSKRVLGLTKYSQWLLDHNKVTQYDFFVETAHRKSKGVLILRTISHHNTIYRHNQKLTQPHKCIVH